MQTLDGLPRTGMPAAPSQPQLFTPRVIEALFAEDSLKSRRNTQAIEVAPNTLVAARVLDYRPAAVRPLDDVKAPIRQRLERQEAAQLARKAGEKQIAALLKQPSDTGFSPPLTVSRRASQGMPPNLLAEVLRTASDKLPTYVGADVEGLGYLIAHVLSGKEGAAGQPAQREAESRALARQTAAADEVAYAQGLRERHKVTILQSEFKRDAARSADSPSTTAKK